MLELKKTPEHTIDRVFLLALLALFAATTFLVVCNRMILFCSDGDN